MDKFYYFEKMHKQHEQEISKQSAWQPNEKQHRPLSRKQAVRLVVRLVVAAIVLSGLFAVL